MQAACCESDVVAQIHQSSRTEGRAQSAGSSLLSFAARLLQSARGPPPADLDLGGMIPGSVPMQQSVRTQNHPAFMAFLAALRFAALSSFFVSSRGP